MTSIHVVRAVSRYSFLLAVIAGTAISSASGQNKAAPATPIPAAATSASAAPAAATSTGAAPATATSATTGTAAPAPKIDTLKRIRDTGTVLIGVREASVPFSFVDAEKKPQGYSVDLCQRVAD